MSTIFRTFICLAAVMLCSLTVNAAPATANYFCDFEDDSESAQWITWPGSSNTRMKHSTWRTGAAAYYTGEKGMYITDLDMASDNTHSFPKASGYTVSIYRKMTLEAGNYTISMDYKCPSELLSVSLMMADTLTTIQTQTGSDYAADVRASLIPGLKDLKSTEWGHASADCQVTVAGTYLLVITYRTSAGPDLDFGAAVDNIEMLKKQTDPTACDYAISNLRMDLTGGYAVLSWKGNADEYEVRYYDSEGHLVILPPVADMGAVDSCRISLNDLADGTYSFMVRGLGCGGNHANTGWAYVRNKLVYDPTEHCIDFLNFDARGVVCKYGEGHWSSSSTHESITSTIIGYTDNGSDSQYNTHTLHFKPNEKDYMTNNQLRTVPEGAFASVRLGSREPNNTSPGQHWQSVTYTIHVTEETGVILFRYAYIGQTGSHDGLLQSHIRLRLTDQTGAVINGEDCGNILFTAPKDDDEMNLLNRNPRTAGWHKGRQDSGTGTVCSDYVYWRDWTTVGVNVEEYIGQDIMIEVTNYGCGDYCHYGYCYFTLDCRKAASKSFTCTQKPDTLTVDEGFDYEWIKPFNPNEPFYEGQDPYSRSLYVAKTDSNTYVCKLMRKGNNECYYTLSASAAGRFPRSKPCVDTVEGNRDRCHLVFGNNSAVFGVYYDDDNVEYATEDPMGMDSLSRYEWKWWTRSNPSQVHTATTYTPEFDYNLLDQEDVIYYELYVAMDEGCDNTNAGQLVVLPRMTVCSDGEPMAFGLPIDHTGYYMNAAKDSVRFYTYVDELLVELKEYPSSICQDLEDRADFYVVVETNMETGVNCELVFDELGRYAGFTNQRVELQHPQRDTIELTQANLEALLHARAGKYNVGLTFSTATGIECTTKHMDIQFVIHYSKNIVQESYGTLLAVLDAVAAEYGMLEYQWYKNDVLIPGATLSYYNLLPNESIDENTTWQVAIKCADGEWIRSCPLGDISGNTFYSDIRDVIASESIPADFDGMMTIFDVLGREIMSAPYDASALDAAIRANHTGIYLVHLSSASYQQTFRVLVR